ncbi:histidine kinase [Phytohabitans sp. ZYX-F-186]|uniref:histidine kinase n=1 Tax=Phytohabitans maris TaxID=3071409 RepID=A0ABU0ZV54_9ACTN|nr:histidine kinase [Phytohabitans sp. ZYX-F-186]MDQ7910916.1 histidine kinase [Phytohabitans sp. ZYX-F-186]
MNEARRRWAADALLAGVLLVIGMGGTRAAGLVQERPVTAFTFVLVAVVALSLVVRRSWPLVTLGVAAVGVSIYLSLGYPYGPIFFSFLVSVYTVARHRPLKPAAIAAGAALTVLLVHTVVDGNTMGLGPAAAWVAVPFAVGVTVRISREAAAQARDDLARRYADEERLRVAQEVHDVVGHGLSAINMQAEIALHLLGKRPEQAEAALTAISRTSREALDELRVTLALVRRTREGETRAATAGLARLDDLVARMSETGVPVEVEVTGDRRDLPAAVDLAAYRVVQESLTNVLRHAGAASATVRLAYLPEEVSVEVVDTGRGAAGPPGGGHGLVGMRERVAALGGEFTAGPVEGGGFRVYARLPLP